jgi:hypothetical protein
VLAVFTYRNLPRMNPTEALESSPSARTRISAAAGREDPLCAVDEEPSATLLPRLAREAARRRPVARPVPHR